MNREYPVENFTIKDDYIDILYRDSETRLLELHNKRIFCGLLFTLF